MFKEQMIYLQMHQKELHTLLQLTSKLMQKDIVQMFQPMSNGVEVELL